MARKVVVRKNRYLDSVFLMAVARRIAAQPGIRDASALLATPENRAILAGMGYGAGDAEFATAGPNDLVLAVEGEQGAVDAVATSADRWLARDAGAVGEGEAPAVGPHTIAEAVAARREASVAVISVPGAHAAREAHAALRLGLHVFLFSSNVSMDDERSLKAEARDRGLVVMGPDCGTAWLGGAGIGFANAVRRGPVGMVGSTGTGMQELACLVHRAGSGISSGIGTGTRDLRDEIGGVSTLAGIEALEADPATRVIAVLSKPPGAATAALLADRLRRCSKPSVLCLLGAEPLRDDAPGGVGRATTLDEAAVLALAAAGVEAPPFLHRDEGRLREAARAQIDGMRPEQRHVRGLFSGGTLCYQAQAVFQRGGLVVHSNSPLHGMWELPDSGGSREDALVDMGAEEFVEGRPHPMIDATLRRRRLEQEGRDPSVAVVLLDFILGSISSSDPVGDMLPAIRGAQAAARARGGQLCVVASVCGTEGDAQGLDRQERSLTEAGVLTFPSAAQAATFSRDVRLLLAARKEAR